MKINKSEGLDFQFNENILRGALRNISNAYLDLEYKRVTSQKSNEVTINIAARGGENELTLSEEKYQKLLQVIEENKDKEIPDIFD